MQKNRLENIRIDCDFPTENGENGAYRDTEKELVIFPNVFNNKFKDYFDKELASNKQMEISNYLLVRTLIHEGLHCISNNDLRHYINDKIELEALDELYTLKLESEIYKEYFEKTFAKGKDLYLKNYQIKEKRKIDLFENGQKETYITTRDLDIHGYGFINKMAHYISFIDKDFTDIYWGKKSCLTSNLNNQLFTTFSKSFLDFSKQDINQHYTSDGEKLFNILNDFFNCIKYQIKNKNINKEQYMQLKTDILNNDIECMYINSLNDTKNPKKTFRL